MREEIEAAALFITRLVNKNLQQSSNACTSTSSSIHSHSSSASSSLSSSASTSSSSSFSSSDGPTDLDDQQQSLQNNQQQASPTTNNNNNNNNNSELDKVEQFRQCLTEALYERFHNHWFPEQPSKGQAYRCIRLNEWDRRDITLQKACFQCGIDYKDLQLPVELTLWVDPDEVTCRFGENKGSHCLVAKFKDGELKDNNIDIDINNIDIQIFGQSNPNDKMTQNQHHQNNYHHLQHHQNIHGMHGSPQHHNNRSNQSNASIHGTYQFLHNSSNNSNHPQQNHHQQHQQSSPQQPPQHHHHQHHRANHLGKAPSAAIITSPYHGAYTNRCDTNGNPVPWYYF